jgi:peptidoglycan/xylan/chitin deacetylase (PgdA/CDA1 family)
VIGIQAMQRLSCAAIFLLISPYASATVLLLHDGDSLASGFDCLGIELALDEVGIESDRIDVRSSPVSSLPLDHPLIVACHLDFGMDPAGALALQDWIHDGGGLLATGRSGLRMETALGLASIVVSDGAERTEVRFNAGYAATSGIGWDGPIAAGSVLPASQLPAVARHYYYDESEGGWPSYHAVVQSASDLGHWHDSTAPWEEPDGAVAVTASQHGAGRAIYSGALPGVHANWDWPRSWRTFVVHALTWLAQDELLVELGHWPHANAAAFAWSGDTEKPAMSTAVPALLQLFDDLGLSRFGTFYTVGQGGGDAGTVGGVEHPEIVQAILDAGSELAGHGDIHTSFSGQDYPTQFQRLQTMRDLLEPMMPAGRRLSGFRAPYLSQDTTTWRALAELGFTHDAGDADVWSNVTLPHRRDGLIQLPPSMPMDWHLFEQYAIDDADARSIWFDKFEYVLARRGLFSWLHHPWVIDGHLDIVEELLQYAIDRGDVWLARQDDIASWWRARSGLEMERLAAWDGQGRVRVVNLGEVAVAGASVWFRLPDGESRAWEVLVGGVPDELFERHHANSLYRVAVIDHLAPGQETVVEVFPRNALFSDRFELPPGD